MKMSIVAFAVLVLISSALGSACDRRSDLGDTKAQETRTTGATQERPSVAQVKDEPAQFYGKRVTVSGQVNDVAGDARSFKLEGNGLFAPDIRVLARAPVKMGGAALSEDDEVTVTGTVRRFVVADVERELGWGLAPDIEVELRDKPVLVADEVRRIQPSATWSAKAPEGELVGTIMLFTAFDPAALAGQRITLSHEKVQSVTGKGLWVGSSHAAQTFVLPTGGAQLGDIKPGDFVDVRGTVRKTPPAAEAIKTWGLPETLRGVVEAEPLYVEASELKRSSAKSGARGGPTKNGDAPAR